MTPHTKLSICPHEIHSKTIHISIDRFIVVFMGMIVRTAIEFQFLTSRKWHLPSVRSSPASHRLPEIGLSPRDQRSIWFEGRSKITSLTDPASWSMRISWGLTSSSRRKMNDCWMERIEGWFTSANSTLSLSIWTLRQSDKSYSNVWQNDLIWTTNKNKDRNPRKYIISLTEPLCHECPSNPTRVVSIRTEEPRFQIWNKSILLPYLRYNTQSQKVTVYLVGVRGAELAHEGHPRGKFPWHLSVEVGRFLHYEKYFEASSKFQIQIQSGFKIWSNSLY